MAGLIKNWLNGTSPILRWLAFEGYARKVFSNEHAGWYREPMRYAAGLVDANKVLRSQVVTFDFGAVFASHAALAVGSTGAERVAVVLRDPLVRAFYSDAIRAIVHQLSAKVDVVLQLPSPSALLVMLGEDVADIDFDMLDDTATLLAGLLRGFAELPIAGVVLAVTDSGADADDEIEACAVLQGVADHYDWVFVLRLDNSDLIDSFSDLSVDLLLIPTLAVGDLAAQARTTGGGLNGEYWISGDLAAVTRACLYGEVPTDFDPKVVVERVANLPC